MTECRETLQTVMLSQCRFLFADVMNTDESLRQTTADKHNDLNIWIKAAFCSAAEPTMELVYHYFIIIIIIIHLFLF